MSNDRFHRLRTLFMEALEIPTERQEPWLKARCGEDAELFVEIRSLLEETNREDDPLEAGLSRILAAESIADSHVSELVSRLTDHPLAQARSELPETTLSNDEFYNALARIDVLSADELRTWAESRDSRATQDDSKLLAEQLVIDGILTTYQAAIVLEGKSENLLIDKYLILDLLDAGGMGIVFKAIHRPMDRVVALKLLLQSPFDSPQRVQRFRREVRTVATLVHPNIVTAFDADESNGMHFLVMEYVEGSDLHKLVRDHGPLSVEHAIDCILQAARGLKHAHDKGIVHRDIKPSNLILSRTNIVKLLDLGLAWVNDAPRNASEAMREDQLRAAQLRQPIGPSLTEVGTLLGTVAYMAPEQASDSQDVDGRTDIYGLGCTLYYLLTGETVFGGTTVSEIVENHRHAPIPHLRRLRPDTPDQLVAAFERMVAKSPSARFQSIGEAISALEACAAANPVEETTDLADRTIAGSRSTSDTSPASRRTSPMRGRLSGIIAATAFLVGVCAIIGFLALNRSDHLESEQGSSRAEPSSDLESNVQPETVPPSSPETDRGLVRTLAVHEAGINDIQISPDGRYIASAADGENNVLIIWDRTNGKICHTLPPEQVQSLRSLLWSPDSLQLLVCGSTINRIHIEDFKTETVASPRQIEQVMWLSGSDRFATWTRHYLCIYRTDTLERVYDFPNVKTVGRQCFDVFPDATRIVFSNDANELSTINIADGTITSTGLVMPIRPIQLRLVPGREDMVLVAGGLGTLELYDLQRQKLVRAFPGHNDNVSSIDLFANGRFAASGSPDNTIRIWDIDTGVEVHRFTASSQWCVARIDISPDERFIFSGGGKYHHYDGRAGGVSFATTRYACGNCRRSSLDYFAEID